MPSSNQEQETPSVVEGKEPLTTSFGGWQNEDDDRCQRRGMVRCVAKLLQDRRSRSQRLQPQSATPESSQQRAAARASMIQIRKYAAKMEQILYASAVTKEEYADTTTLMVRLRMVANGIQWCRRSSGSSRSCLTNYPPAAPQA